MWEIGEFYLWKFSLVPEWGYVLPGVLGQKTLSAFKMSPGPQKIQVLRGRLTLKKYGWNSLCFPFHFQVQRDFRHKQSSAGQAMTVEEKAQYGNQLDRFFKSKPLSVSAEKQKSNAKKVLAQPRLATLDWLRTTEHSMRQATGMCFANFNNSELLAQAEVTNDSVILPEGSAPKSAAGVPSLLVLSSDRCSTQMCVVNFLVFKLKISAAFLCDPSHAAWRSILDGLTQSGHLAVITIAQVIYNVAYGPYQRCSFFRYLSEASVDAAQNVGDNDPLLLFLWENIADDLGWQGEDRGELGRRKFLEMLPAMEAGSLKGPKASPGRFYSFCQAHRFWDATHHAKLFLICYTSIRMGWAMQFKDLFRVEANVNGLGDSAMESGDGTGLSKPALRGEESGPLSVAASGPSASSSADPPLPKSMLATKAGSTQAAGHPSAPASSAASSSAASGSGAPAPAPTIAKAKAEAQSVTAGEKSRSANTLHAVGRMLADASLTNQIRMLGLASNILAVKYGAAYHEMRNPSDTMRWYSEWAHWSQLCLYWGLFLIVLLSAFWGNS